MFPALSIEEGLRANLQAYKRAAEEYPISVLEHSGGRFAKHRLAFEGGDQHTTIQKGPSFPRHYLRPRRSAISRSNSRRFNSFPPPAM